MKKLLTLFGIALLFTGGTVLATNDKPKEDHKVTICHATSSETNPWVRTVVDEHATAGHFDNNGTPLAGHEGDKLLEGDVDCPATPPKEEQPPVVTTPPKTETPAPENPGIVSENFGK